MDIEALRFRLHNKWIAVALWLALLAALAYTSANGVTLAFGGSPPSYLRFIANPPPTSSDQSASAMILALGSLVVNLTFVYLILRAWLRFARLTHQLIISYAASDRPNGVDSVFYDMLDFEVDNDNQLDDKDANSPDDHDPTDSDRSSVSDVVTALAYTWAAIILAPPLISVITIVLAKPTQ